MVDYHDVWQTVFYNHILGFPPPLYSLFLLIPQHVNLYLFGSLCIFTLNIGLAVKSVEGRQEVVRTPFNNITSRKEKPAACQPAHPRRGKDYYWSINIKKE